MSTMSVIQSNDTDTPNGTDDT